MKLNALLKNFVNDREHHKRKIGRYWSSDIWEIMNDKLHPWDFLEDKTFDLKACRNIAEGELRELGLKMLLDSAKIKYNYQPKEIIKINDFELVVVADFDFPDKIVECKSPTKINGIKEYHFPQLEAQYRAFGKPVFVMYLKERWEYKSYRYIPDNNLWLKIQEELKNFHQKLTK